MAQFARPSSDLNLGGWTNPSWSAIDEATASDVDATTSPTAPASAPLVVALSAVEDPISSTGHVVRYRYRKSATGGAQINLTVELRQGYVSEASQGTLIASWSHTNIDAVTTAAQTLTGPQADAITNYAALALRFVATQV